MESINYDALSIGVASAEELRIELRRSNLSINLHPAVFAYREFCSPRLRNGHNSI